MTLGEKLQQLRNKRNLSMSQVARMSEKATDHRGKITQGYISRLESGKETNPSLLKLITLCGIYKTKPGVLFIKNNSRKKSRKSR
jgi:transcriptional regulator with XRE-family HTH domain